MDPFSSVEFPKSVPLSEANLVCDPREILEPPAPRPPEEYGRMLKLWTESPGYDNVTTDNADRAFYKFVKSSSDPAAKVTLQYFEHGSS